MKDYYQNWSYASAEVNEVLQQAYKAAKEEDWAAALMLLDRLEEAQERVKVEQNKAAEILKAAIKAELDKTKK